MKRIEVSVLAALALLSLLLGIALVQEKQVSSNLKIKLELTNQELQDTQGDRDYYKSQYQKYFELSEELQNQMGVYITVNAVDFKTKKPINSNRIWQLKKCYTLFAVITDGYTEHIIETKYIKSKPRSN